MGKMLTDQQYQRLLSRSGGTNLSSQLLLAQSQSHRDQYLSRTAYPDRVAPDAHYATGSSLAIGSSARYPSTNRSDAYLLPSDGKDIRAQASVDRRPLLASAPMMDYPPQRYGDRIGSRATPISPEVAPYSSQCGVLPLPNGAAVASPAELLARAQRLETVPAYTGSYGNGARRLVSSAYDDHEFPPVLPKVQAGFSKSDASRGRDMDRYLLAVQPEKLVRYTAACLTAEPTLKRTRYSVMGNELNPEEDVYSNYRRAKTLRTGSHEFRGNSHEPRADRERESYRVRERYRGREQYPQREPYRERRRVDGAGNRRKSSPSRRLNNNSMAKDKGANRGGRVANSSQPSEGKGRRNGDPCSGNRPSGNSERANEEPASQEPVPDQPAAAKAKEENGQESDEDSELGSLCADLSDSDEDKKKKPKEPAKVARDTLAGMIFGCSSATFHECMRLQLFGLPAKNKDDVLRVSPGTKVFLFNFDTKELSGIFEAISDGGWQIDPEAFRDFGGFPSQVQVCCSEQCPNLSLSTFKPAILDNYINQHKFKFDLNAKQVKDLVRLFRKAARARPRQRDDVPNHYSARLQSQDYSMRGIQQQRPYSRHPQVTDLKNRPGVFMYSRGPYESVRI